MYSSSLVSYIPVIPLVILDIPQSYHKCPTYHTRISLIFIYHSHNMITLFTYHGYRIFGVEDGEQENIARLLFSEKYNNNI